MLCSTCRFYSQDGYCGQGRAVEQHNPPPFWDRSKLRTPEVSVALDQREVEIFTEHGPKLKGSTYGSQEYMANLQAMGPALQHHYKSCRHHPEHYPNGISDMNLFDVLEMLIQNQPPTVLHQ